MKIIITAAGEGSRFKEIGIKKPKYEIIANNNSLFFWSLNSLKNFFNHEFIFIFRYGFYNENFVKEELKKLGINKFRIVLIDELTDGQATTAMFAKKFVNNDDSIMIYNIDTSIKYNSLNESLINYDGSITVSKANGDHWSFAKLGSDGFVCEVSEKIRISEYASIGPYYFKKWSDFEWVFNNYKEDIKSKYKEAYICPMYQYLIDNGKKIIIYEIQEDDYVCLGTPNEIKEFDDKWLENNQ